MDDRQGALPVVRPPVEGGSAVLHDAPEMSAFDLPWLGHHPVGESMSTAAQAAAAEVAEMRRADDWNYCVDCKTPYRMEDLRAVPKSEPTYYACGWHAARRHR